VLAALAGLQTERVAVVVVVGGGGGGAGGFVVVCYFTYSKLILFARDVFP
jgi:hypothetical protein